MGSAEPRSFSRGLFHDWPLLHGDMMTIKFCEMLEPPKSLIATTELVINKRECFKKYKDWTISRQRKAPQRLFRKEVA